jgi:hypothetical protein
MDKNFSYGLPVVAFLVVLLLPAIVFACNANSNVWNISILKGPLITCTGAGAVGGTDQKNCTDFCDLICTSANVIYFGIGVVLWIIMPIMFAWSGLMLILSRGNPNGTSNARKMLTGTVIGLLIVLCAYIIVYTFVNVLNISGVGGFTNPSCTIQS